MKYAKSNGVLEEFRIDLLYHLGKSKRLYCARQPGEGLTVREATGTCLRTQETA